METTKKNPNILDTARQRILQFIENQGLTASEFLTETGLKRGFIDKSHIKSGASDTNLAKILESYPELSAEWLVTGRGNMINEVGLSEPNKTYSLRTDKDIELQRIPIFNLKATAGLVSVYDLKEYKSEEEISLPNLPRCDGSTYISGDSMYPLLHPGDIVAYQIVKDIQNDIFFGEMYLMAISTSDEDFVTVKYVHKSEQGDEYIRLVSENNNHPSQDIHRSKLRTIAHIKATIRYNSMK